MEAKIIFVNVNVTVTVPEFGNGNANVHVHEKLPPSISYLLSPITFLLIFLMFQIGAEYNPIRLEPNVLLPYNAVSYEFSKGGRLGDNLTAFLHAKWISYKYNIPLLYNHFEYGDKLRLHDIHQHMGIFYFSRAFLVKSEIEIITEPCSSLYVIPYFAEAKSERYLFGLGAPDFDADWNDPEFKKLIKESISPKEPLNLLVLPSDCKTVALHVRRGGGFDDPAIYKVFNEKFPQDEFFIEQLKYVAEFYPNQKIYVHLFTDDRDPYKILKTYEEALNNPNMVFNCRYHTNHHMLNVLEDLFSMAQFDCIIRGSSSFAIVACLIGDPELVIYPAQAHWEDDRQVIDQVEFVIKKS